MPVPTVSFDVAPLPALGQAAEVFNPAMDAFIQELPAFVAELNAAGDAIDIAVADAEDAADAAVAAAAGTVTGTSTSSVAIGTGSKAFTTQAGKNWVVGTWLMIASAADPADYMTGQVTAYSGTALTVNVTVIGGTGTDADWNISLAGAVGVTGAPGADGAGAWAAIGSAVATTSGTSWAFTSIPQTYQDLLIVIAGFSHSGGGSAALQIEVSANNGSTYSTPAVFGVVNAAANVVDGGALISRYRGDQGVMNATAQIALGASPASVATTETGISWKATGGINAIRLSHSSGYTGDAGSITLYGR